MRRHNLSKTALVFCLLIICFAFVASHAEADQCATFDFSTNTVNIPCFNFENSSYWIDLGLVSSGLDIQDFGNNGAAGDLSLCATFNSPTNTLHMPCFEFDNISYWINLSLISSNPVLLGVKDYGINSDVEYSQSDVYGTWGGCSYFSGSTGGNCGTVIITSDSIIPYCNNDTTDATGFTIDIEGNFEGYFEDDNGSGTIYGVMTASKDVVNFNSVDLQSGNYSAWGSYTKNNILQCD